MLYPRDCRSDLAADLVDDLNFCSISSSPSAISTLVHQLLLAILHTNGPDRLLANLPRRTSEGIPGLPKRRASHTLRLDMVDMSRKEEEDFTECHFAARRLGLARDVWQILAGKAAKEGSHAASTRSAEPRVKQESSPWAEGMTPFLDILVQAWELEARVMALDEQPLGEATCTLYILRPRTAADFIAVSWTSRRSALLPISAKPTHPFRLWSPFGLLLDPRSRLPASRSPFRCVRGAPIIS